MSSVAAAVEQACRRIAPSWPLDRFLAVNPYWGHLDTGLGRAAAELGVLSGAGLLTPRALHREAWRDGRLGREHIEAAIRAEGADCSADELIELLAQDDPPPPRPLPLLTGLADARRRPGEPQPWADLVVQQISQHCAAFFDASQRSWALCGDDGLYGSWRRLLPADRGLPLRAGRAATAARAAALPATAQDCIGHCSAALGLEPEQRAPYYTALLGSVRGWAAFCAQLRWQAGLGGGRDDRIVELLAIRLAWEVLLAEDQDLGAELPAWRARLAGFESEVARRHAVLGPDLLLQRAAEIAFQMPLAEGLRAAWWRQAPHVEAAVQAVFCIDVRSERFRRALEVASDDFVQTRGFAGFFGLSLEFSPLGTCALRPQLPGLLAPTAAATEAAADGASTAALAARRQAALGRGARWAGFRAAATSAFTFVEACGLLHGFGLLRRSLGRFAPAPTRAGEAGLGAGDRRRLRPAWVGSELEERIDLAARVLRSMGLCSGFARLVLLAGHGSSSTNNPHAAGLDCGACGGQTGEVNARLLALLLDEPEVRAGLARRGIEIPESTQFVAGLHDTTTDELELFDLDRLPESHAGDLRRLRGWLTEAGIRTRAERAPDLGLGALAGRPDALARALRARARDWAQVRPEWGLADNAAFVVAPRRRTLHLDLGGRVFLHDYAWETDQDFATLRLILTAPMLVTNWINLQYLASTVDNRSFGSGNKVLHNVVGGRIGVFEGNGGDLRIGLPLQSLHDGTRWRHTPLRLSVFVEAPRDAIDGVIGSHEVVRQLVDHGWLHLLQLDVDGAVHRRRPGGGWGCGVDGSRPDA
jgi:uncharacterized protein YbcC (UPF0753/DUF2309 family)